MRIKLGLIGCGWAAQTHAQVIAERDDAMIEVVMGPSERARQFAKEFKIPHWTRSLDSILQGHLLDAFIVCVPPHAAPALVRQLHTLNKHILVEKPVGRSSRDIDELLTTCHDPSMVSVGLQFRSSSWFQDLQNLIRSQAFGEIVYVYHRMHFPSTSRVWAFSPNTSPGIFIEAGVHGIDLFLKLFGPVRSVHRITTKQGDVDIAGQIYLEHKSGVRSVIDVSYFGALHQHSGLTEIQGTKGFFCLDRGPYVDRNPRIIQEFGGKARITECHDVGFKRQMSLFLAAVTAGVLGQLPTLEDMRAAIRIVEDIPNSQGGLDHHIGHLE